MQILDRAVLSGPSRAFSVGHQAAGGVQPDEQWAGVELLPVLQVLLPRVLIAPETLRGALGPGSRQVSGNCWMTNRYCVGIGQDHLN